MQVNLGETDVTTSATQEINTKITLSWALKQFVTRVHTLFSINASFTADTFDGVGFYKTHSINIYLHESNTSLSFDVYIYMLCLNPLRAKFFRGNINIYLHFMSLLHIDMTQVLKILPLYYIVNIMAADVLAT